MEKNQKVALTIFTATMIVLAGMLWMPNLAGPDGLEQVTFDLTDDDEYEPKSDVDYEGSPMPDYTLSENDGYFSSWVVGLIGSLIVFVLFIGIIKLITVSKKKTAPEVISE